MQNYKSFQKINGGWIWRICLPIGLAILLILVLFVILGRATPASADPGTLYVDWATGADAGNCQSPAAPCQTISYAIGQAVLGDDIFVAQGTYTENLTINNGIALMGGYEAVGWTRNIANYKTILDGNQSGSVLTFQGSSEGMALDGFTVTGGKATSGGIGGGITVDGASPVIKHTIVISNQATADGGGIYISGGVPTIEESQVRENIASGCCGGIHVGNDASVIISDAQLISNTSLSGGGLGVYSGSAVTVTKSIISGNNTDSEFGQGGGIHLGGGAPLVNIMDSKITDNQTRDHGAAMSSDSGTINLTNVLVTGNESTSGNANAFAISGANLTLMNSTIADNNTGGAQAVLLWSGSFTMTNSIMWNNALSFQSDPVCNECFSVTYSDIQGGWSGTGNIDEDPLFVGVDDYHLQNMSPGINRGTPTGAPSTDIAGNPRDAKPDMGAYEWIGSRIYLPLTVRSGGS
jgi:hypothetical protein